MKNSEIGREGEQLVKNHYQKNNYKLVEANYNFYRRVGRGRLGEIDLIFEKNNILILVEVKTRTTKLFGDVHSQITNKKMQLIEKTYNQFIQKNPRFKDYYVRFDFAGVYNHELSIIENAYSFEKY